MPPRQSASRKDWPDSPTSAKSSLSCHTCRRLKRRCDRQYPYCSLCHQKQVACSYPHHRKERVRRIVSDSSPSSYSDTSPRHNDIGTGQCYPLPSTLKKDNAHHQLSELNELHFLTASFLDPDDFILAQLEAEKSDVAISKYVADMVGSVSDIQDTAQKYFESAHAWMPIVSKWQFHQKLLQRLAVQRVELFLLVLAMKLLSSRPKTAKSRLYRTVKQLYFDAESAGRLSVQLLQAAVFIALYEIGHGIYPTAIISVANCARVGTILGLNEDLNNAGTASMVSWMEMEERHRVWWSILILDRFINLSCGKKSLVTSDPDPESYLPVDDDDFDIGTSQSGDAIQLRVSSHVHIGRFARFAHSVPLPSQAILRTGDKQEHTEQLRRTILSLTHLGDVEGEEDRMLFCTLNATSYMAVFALDRVASQPGLEANRMQSQQTEEIATPESISAIQLGIETMSLEASQIDYEKLSPFLIHMMYKALTISLRLSIDPPVGMNVPSNIQLLKRGLQYFGSRWRAAETYFLLAKRKELFSPIETP